MRLSLETRDIGRVTVVRCAGRIVSGDESESLRTHVAWLLRDRKTIVLHLGEVAFVDSSGVGTMVRALTSVRQKGGDLKLCNVPEHTHKVLRMKPHPALRHPRLRRVRRLGFLPLGRSRRSDLAYRSQHPLHRSQRRRSRLPPRTPQARRPRRPHQQQPLRLAHAHPRHPLQSFAHRPRAHRVSIY